MIRPLIISSMIVLSTLLSACSTVKTKQDCIQECADRGAQYVGVVPEARKNASGWGMSDVCQCR